MKPKSLNRAVIGFGAAMTLAATGAQDAGVPHAKVADMI